MAVLATSVAPATVLALSLVWLLGVCSVPEVRVYLSRDVDRDHHTRAVYLLTTIGLEGAGLIILRGCRFAHWPWPWEPWARSSRWV